MFFSTNTPLSQQYIAPDFATGAARGKLGLLGYDASGQQNAWGKVSSWIPGINLLQNKIAQNVAQNSGAGDAAMNIQQDFDNRLMKLGTEAGIGLGVAGGLTGNPELLKTGLNLTTQFAGSLAFDQNNLITEGQSIYR